MTDYNLVCETRSDLGKGASRRLRREGWVPGVVYGAGEAVSVSAAGNKLGRMLEDEGSYASIWTLTLDGKEEHVVLKDLHRHPFREEILHFDLQRVADDSPIRVRVPLHVLGATGSPVIKAGGSMTTHLTTVEVSCLPKDLPESLDIDCSDLDGSRSVRLSDIKLPEGVELVELKRGMSHDQSIVSVKVKGEAKTALADALDDDAPAEAPAEEDAE